MTPCPVCGAPIPVRPPSGGKQRQQCSTACYRKANSARTRVWARKHYATNPNVRAKLLAYERQKKEKKRRIANSILRCGECGCSAPLDLLFNNRNKAWLCSSECRAERKRKIHHQWYVDHREEQLPKYSANRIKAKAENPDYFKQLYARNRERRKKESREWYHDNAEYATQRNKAYAAKRRAEQPDHVRAIGRKGANTRRARTNLVFVEVIDHRVVFDRDKGICGICLTPVDPVSQWEIDHVIPISKGGPHSYANVQLAHRRCNRAKCNRVPVDGRRDPALHERD